ncbi:hypothetical protein [Desulfonatronovibrio magnus]|uniref:hypothetical protein n=1 Tax=Desulfonatronovibrio magnus TaxID=698827 RepID=UPI0005EB98FC|nr:hypothetical protein [Desulfonatronovibrio magnus]
MKAIRKTFSLTETDRNIKLNIPKNFGSKIEIIILPVGKTQDVHGRFEIVAEDGMEYKMPNWTEDEFKTIGVSAFFDTNEDADVDWEDWFGLR